MRGGIIDGIFFALIYLSYGQNAAKLKSGVMANTPIELDQAAVVNCTACKDGSSQLAYDDIPRLLHTNIICLLLPAHAGATSRRAWTATLPIISETGAGSEIWTDGYHQPRARATI